MKLKLPNDWTEKTIWNPKPSETVSGRTQGVLAYYNRQKKIIEYYPRWWLAPIWFILYPLIRKHELGHVYGIKKCLGKHKWCIMYEDEDSWSSKFFALLNLAYGRGKFCSDCKSYLNLIRSLNEGSFYR